MMRGGRRPAARVSTAVDAARNFDLAVGHRNSDASLCSSRPSSASMGPARPAASALLLTDRAAQSAALRSVNAYLSSLSPAAHLKPPLPSARDITDAFRAVLARLDWPLADLDDDLLALLRALRCPLKLSRSVLKAPGTPHAWPPLLSALHWLVQLARVADLLAASPADPSNDLLPYLTQSYSFFISGDDDAVKALDTEYLTKAEHQATNAANAVDALQKDADDLEARACALTAGPSRREALEKERAMLAQDAKKFEEVIEGFSTRVATKERDIEVMVRELAAKEEEVGRIAGENEELRRQIEGQAVSMRDAEKMRREMQTVERDIVDAENGIISLDEKASEIEAAAGQKLKELETLVEECNQAIRKLKLGNEFEYVLNADGSSPAEVMGINYKTTLKPALSALAEETKKMSVSKLEESINLQEQSRENAKMLEEKRDCLAALQAKVDQSVARLSLLKKEMEDYGSKYSAEVENMTQEFTIKEHQLLVVEKEAEEFLKSSEQSLQEAIKETDTMIQMCAHELLAVIDVVSEHKEYIESTVSGMEKDLSETARSVAEAHKSCSSTKFTSGLNLSHSGLKRARYPSAN